MRDGGLVAASANYNYLAPEEGYQRTYREAHDPGDDDWKPGFSKLFYLKLRNGRVFAVTQITLTNAGIRGRAFSGQERSRARYLRKRKSRRRR